MNNRIGDRAVSARRKRRRGLLAAHVLAESYGQVIASSSETSCRRPPCTGEVPAPAGTFMRWPRGGKQSPQRSLFPGSPRKWSLTERRPVACWPTRGCTSAATGFGRPTPVWCFALRQPTGSWRRISAPEHGGPHPSC